MNKLQVLMIAPGEYPFNEELSNSKSALTKAVNIGIKHSYRPAYMDIDDNVCVMYNSQRGFTDLKPSRKINNDILCGHIYIIGKNKDGTLRSLDYDEQVKYSQMFWEPEIYSDKEKQSANLTYTYYTQLKYNP